MHLRKSFNKNSGRENFMKRVWVAAAVQKGAESQVALRPTRPLTHQRGLTYHCSTPRGRFAQVVADEQGKKMTFLWSIHSSPATKSSSTRPQQVVNSTLGYSFCWTSESLFKASISLLCPWIPTWSTSWLYLNTYDTV
ncbi:hypothetical protein Taro_056455 [Colocasia esculenta]|uniref:Uncharacterized protein n=1 Tax=Colocasia esculenta TaxID=4460 RepID=A0A843XWJ0_COLES|nr:hypothetical protein [Colocasia esculenta]